MTQPNIILGHLIELIGNVADAYTCALFTIEPGKKELVLREHFTLSRNLDRGAKIAVGKGPIGLAAQTRKPQLIENFDQNTRFLGIYKKNEDLKSFIALPVIYGDQVAVLAIDTKERYQFSIKLQKILSEFTQQIAWSLESKTPETSSSAQPILQEINSYCRFLAESPDRSSVADRLTQIPLSLIPCPAIAVIWFEENQSEGRIIGHRGFANDLSETQVRLGRGLVGSCAKNKSPLLLQTHEGRKAVIFAEDEKPEDLQCAAALPIQHNDTLYGVLLIGSAESEGVSHSDLDKLALIVSAAASALFCADTKDRWVYDKNLDPITGVPNHRFLTEYHLSLSEEVFKSKDPVFFLTFHITNLAELYEAHGVDHGDAYLKQAMALFSKVVPSPKFVFRLSETCFLILLMDRSQKDVELLTSKLKHLLEYNPLYVKGVSIQAQFQWGLSAYPEEGKELFNLINLSRNRLTQKKKAMA
ncbi:MAG: GAF domain-containing protein [Nitrospinae bacterium]|nr:GAF domain-containing protein [Nitrospinota bacterium]MBL7020863.1 GAF domain-containing protein [Nitrospinaceae bacterium]